MRKYLEVNWKELTKSYVATDFTQDGKNYEKLLCENKPIQRLEFALSINEPNYNIYISSNDEKSVYEYILKKVKEVAKLKETPDDICYIYNFQKPSQPLCLFLKSGDGIKLANDLKEIRNYLITFLLKLLNSDEMKAQKEEIRKQYIERKKIALEEIKIEANKLNFLMNIQGNEIEFFPLNENKKKMAKEEYESLEELEKVMIQKYSKYLYSMLQSLLDRFNGLEKTELENLINKYILAEITPYIEKLKSDYIQYREVEQYIDYIFKDMMENIKYFDNKSNYEKLIEKYDINVIVSNADKGAPVITSKIVDYRELIGKIKVESDENLINVDFRNIDGGLLHKANGGYLILYVRDIMDSQGGYRAIKKTLRRGAVSIENLGSGNVVTTLNTIPQDVPVNFKVILIGSEEDYLTLSNYDSDFSDVYKMHIRISDKIKATRENVSKFVNIIKNFCKKENLLPIREDAINVLLKYSHKNAESQKKISTDMSKVFNLIRESNIFANKIVTEEDVYNAVEMQRVFKEGVQKTIEERYLNNTVLLDTEGKKVGQINGLAVYGNKEIEFGRPTRITVTSYMGQSGVVDIENVVGLSGSIHAKGIQIIRGFLGNCFAQEYPLSLSCKICFEQSYGRVDGDSASSAELYALLSSLSDIPLRQEIAVTGSINQYGEIQPVGGVNAKIEGFYRICKEKGLTGSQGVIIPYQNKEDLMLNREIVNAVKEGKFHIYAIESYQEGMQILTELLYHVIEQKVKNKLELYSTRKQRKGRINK